jgi:hypothetical protein
MRYGGEKMELTFKKRDGANVKNFTPLYMWQAPEPNPQFLVTRSGWDYPRISYPIQPWVFASALRVMQITLSPSNMMPDHTEIQGRTVFLSPSGDILCNCPGDIVGESVRA